jgi:rubrerythrin
MGNFEQPLRRKEPPMSTERTETDEGAEEYVRFWAAGETAKGEYRCAECSYGVTVHRVLPVCPMCSGSAWEQSTWRPFSRSRLP